jgi:hypothetical protein
LKEADPSSDEEVLALLRTRGLSIRSLDPTTREKVRLYVSRKHLEEGLSLGDIARQIGNKTSGYSRLPHRDEEELLASHGGNFRRGTGASTETPLGARREDSQEDLALSIKKGTLWSDVAPKRDALRRSVHDDVAAFTKQAEEDYLRRHPGANF